MAAARLDAALAQCRFEAVKPVDLGAAVAFVEEHGAKVAVIASRTATDVGRALRRAAGGPLPLLVIGDAQADEVLEAVYGLGRAEFAAAEAPVAVLAAKLALLAELQSPEAERAAASERQRERDSDPGAEQERFQLLTEAASDYALFFLNPDGVITEWTRSAELLFGFPETEAVGRKGDFLFNAEDRAKGAPAAELREAMQKGQARDNRLHVRKEAPLFPTNGRTVALRNEAGELRGFAKIVRDATTIELEKDKERKFREIFETAHEGIWILDAEGRVQMVNERMAQMLGYGIDELIGRHKTDFVFESDRPEIARLFEERRAGKKASVEIRFRHRDGHAVWTLMAARPLERDGKFAGALDMFSDITARRRAEERFRVFFELSAVGYALIEPGTRRFLNVNQHLCDILRRPREELLRLTFTDITHADDRPADQRRFGDLFAGRVSEVSVEKRYVRGDGTVVWGHVTSTIVRDQAGTPELQLSVVRDITKRKAAEEELHESQTRLRLAVDAADLGVYFHEVPDGRLIWNDQARRLLGIDADATPSVELFFSCVHPEDRDRLRAELQQLFEKGEPQTELHTEFRVLRGDGTLRRLASNGILEAKVHADGRRVLHLIGTIRDVTAQRAFELELRQQVAARTRELEEKTHQLEGFCYTVAHDLRAPLRAIAGYADLLRDEMRSLPAETVVAYLDKVTAATARLDQLIRDLLAYSRVTDVEVQLETVDLNRAVEAALAQIAPEISARGARVDVAASLPSVVGEFSIVEQVLVNLLGNAVKFGQPGTSPKVSVGTSVYDGWVRIMVRDAGIGIPAEYHQRIFKVFERLHEGNEIPGTGIGLAIVAKAVERLGGRYGVESEVGRGSTFWVELRRARA